eukprot:PhF_6_TR27898/c0_g1_i10/m.40903
MSVKHHYEYRVPQGWARFSPDISQQIHDAVSKNKQDTIIELQQTKWILRFNRWVMVNPSGAECDVREADNQSVHEGDQDDMEGYGWVFVTRDGRFVFYPPQMQEMLNQASIMLDKGGVISHTHEGYFGDIEAEIKMVRPGKYIDVIKANQQRRLVRRGRASKAMQNAARMFVWAHQDMDTDQWVPFDDQDQYLIEQAFSRREKQYVLQGGGEDNGGVLDFARMKYSVHPQGNLPKENLRRAERQTTRFEPEVPALESRTYEYRVPSGWAPFPTNVSQKISDAVTQNKQDVMIELQQTKWIVRFNRWVMVNPSGAECDVREADNQSVRGGDQDFCVGGYGWVFVTRDGRFVLYPPHMQEMLKQASIMLDKGGVISHTHEGYFG